MNEVYQNSTVLDLVLNNQPYKTEAMVERQNALNQLHTTNAIKQQEALLKAEKEGSYAWLALKDSIAQLQRRAKQEEKNSEQGLRAWRDDHEEYKKVGECVGCDD